MSTTIESLDLANIAISLVTRDTAAPAGWQVAVNCHSAQQTDIQAIQAVFDALPPPAYLSTVATIVGAVYADTYWSNTFPDPTILAASLQQGGGWGAQDCLQAAQNAFANWRGMLVRGNFNDVGIMPRPGGPDSATNSPDVVVNAAGPLSPTMLMTQWNSRFFNAATGQKNYVYARAQSANFPLDLPSANVRMFATSAGFNQPPSTWQILYTLDNQISLPLVGMNVTAGPVPPGGRTASSDAFMFQPQQDGHYCLISVVSTDYFANNPLQELGNWSWTQWISCNGAAGWHNLDAISPDTVTLKFYNQDYRAERFAFEVHSHKLPVGARVTLGARDADVRSALAVPHFFDGSGRRTRSEVVLRPGYEGELTVRVELPDGGQVPEDAMVEVRMLWVLPPDHERHQDARTQLRAVPDAQTGAVNLPMGTFSLVGSIR